MEVDPWLLHVQVHTCVSTHTHMHLYIHMLLCIFHTHVAPSHTHKPDHMKLHRNPLLPRHIHTHSCTDTCNTTSTWTHEHVLPPHTYSFAHEYAHTCTSQALYLSDEAGRHLNAIFPRSQHAEGKFFSSLHEFCFVVLAVYSVFKVFSFALYLPSACVIGHGAFVLELLAPSSCGGWFYMGKSLTRVTYASWCFLSMNLNPPPQALSVNIKASSKVPAFLFFIVSKPRHSQIWMSYFQKHHWHHINPHLTRVSEKFLCPTFKGLCMLNHMRKRAEVQCAAACCSPSCPVQMSLKLFNVKELDVQGCVYILSDL